MTGSAGSADPLLGRVVASKFQIEAVVGHGNGGTVYRATHLQLRRPVALKVLRAALAADRDAVARFSREAQIASQLDHPHIVHVFDHGVEDDGLTYLAMEFLEGHELAGVIHRDFPLRLERIVAIMSQVLSALAAAHRVGIVHRDMKPENVMLVERVGDDGQPVEFVKVTDFGIAKAYGAAAERVQQITTFGQTAGTPEYVSPEQAYGGDLDGRSDLYSCGVMLYQMLTHELPFTGGTALEIFNRHINEPVVPPSQRYPRADRRLEPVVMRALAKSRDDRFTDAPAMRTALLAVLQEAEPSLLFGIGEATGMTPLVPAESHEGSARIEISPEATSPEVVLSGGTVATAAVEQVNAVTNDDARRQGAAESVVPGGPAKPRRAAWRFVGLAVAVLLGSAALTAAGIVAWRAWQQRRAAGAAEPDAAGAHVPTDAAVVDAASDAQRPARRAVNRAGARAGSRTGAGRRPRSR